MTTLWAAHHCLYPQVQFRRVFRPLRRPVPAGAEIVTAYTNGEVTLRRNRRLDGYHEAADLSGFQGVEVGDFVVHGLDILRGSVGVSDSRGAISSVCVVAAPALGADARYFSYVIRAQSFSGFPRALARGVREGGADFRRWDTLAALPIPLPSESQQHVIAEYLDRETARVDGLIARRSQMAAVVSERASLATAALVLTGRVKGDIISADGDYLPPAPRGWSRTTLRHLRCLVQTGPFGSQLHADEYVTDGWPVVNPANLRDGQIRSDRLMTVSDEKRNVLKRHVLRPGDIVFGRRGQMGRAGLVTDTEDGWLCGTGSLLLRLADDRLTPEYLKLLLETPPLRAYYGIESVGSTMDNLNAHIVLGSPILVPPPDEQKQIVEDVRVLREEANAVLELFHRQVVTMQEHRQALITAAVTGQLDVTKAVA